MSKEDEAERKAFGGIIPARPKGASGPTPPPPLDDLLNRRRQTMPTKVQFSEDPDHPMAASVVETDEDDPFTAFSTIMSILKKQPEHKRKRILKLVADLLD